MTWQEELEEILGGYLGDMDIESGVADMVDSTSVDLDYHRTILSALEEAVRSAEAGDPVVVDILNRSPSHGRKNMEKARAFLRALRDEYIAQYNADVNG